MDLQFIIVAILVIILIIVLSTHIFIISKPVPVPVPVPVPNPNPIGGCAGTRYGCCPYSQIPKLNEIGSNCPKY